MSLQNAFENLATAANQDTEIASLASIDGKLPALDAGRIPVTLPATPIPVATEDGSLLGTEDALREIVRALSWLTYAIDLKPATNGWTLNAPTIRATLCSSQNINAINTLTGVTTVSTVTNQAQMGGIPANYDQYFQAWNYEATLIAKALA